MQNCREWSFFFGHYYGSHPWASGRPNEALCQQLLDLFFLLVVDCWVLLAEGHADGGGSFLMYLVCYQLSAAMVFLVLCRRLDA